LKEVRNQIHRSLKQQCTWDFLNTKNAPNGASATIRVFGIEQNIFCALTGRSNDPNLTTLVKKGAWYSCDNIDFGTVLGSGAGSIYGSGGRYGSNGQLGICNENPLTCKYCPGSKTLSVTGYVQHSDTFGF